MKDSFPFLILFDEQQLQDYNLQTLFFLCKPAHLSLYVPVRLLERLNLPAGD